jgi:hypothetical protein
VNGPTVASVTSVGSAFGLPGGKPPTAMVVFQVTMLLEPGASAGPAGPCEPAAPVSPFGP